MDNDEGPNGQDDPIEFADERQWSYRRVDDRIWRNPRLGGECLRVYCAIEYYSGLPRGAIASQRQLAEDLSISRRTLQRALSTLAAEGVLRIESRTGPSGGQTTNRYVLLPAPTPASNLTHPPRVTDDAPPASDLTHGMRMKGSEHEGFSGSSEPEVFPSTTSSQVFAVGNPSPSLPKTSTPRPRGRAIHDARPEVERLCQLLAGLVADRGVKRPTVTQGWRDACRLMLDRDGLTEEEVEGAIRWSHNDGFWRANVLSMPTLREKFPQLKLQSERRRMTVLDAHAKARGELDDLIRRTRNGHDA